MTLSHQLECVQRAACQPWPAGDRVWSNRARAADASDRAEGSSETEIHAMREAVVQQPQACRPFTDRRPVDRGGTDAASDTVRIVDPDLIAGGSVSNRH